MPTWVVLNASESPRTQRQRRREDESLTVAELEAEK